MNFYTCGKEAELIGDYIDEVDSGRILGKLWEKMSAAELSDIIQHFEVTTNPVASSHDALVSLLSLLQTESGSDVPTAVRYLTSDVAIARTIRTCLSLQIQPAEVSM